MLGSTYSQESWSLGLVAVFILHLTCYLDMHVFYMLFVAKDSSVYISWNDQLSVHLDCVNQCMFYAFLITILVVNRCKKPIFIWWLHKCHWKTLEILGFEAHDFLHWQLYRCCPARCVNGFGWIMLAQRNRVIRIPSVRNLLFMKIFFVCKAVWSQMLRKCWWRYIVRVEGFWADWRCFLDMNSNLIELDLFKVLFI